MIIVIIVIVIIVIMVMMIEPRAVCICIHTAAQWRHARAHWRACIHGSELRRASRLGIRAL